MRIVQILPTLGYGDAIGNEALAIDAYLKHRGIPTMIYARNIDMRVDPSLVCTADQYTDDKSTVILYHFSTGDELNTVIKSYKAEIILRYHNVTPPKFWIGYSEVNRKLSETGLAEIKALKDTPILCITDSDFNQRDLKSYGFTCPMHTVPILMDFKELGKEVHAKLPFDDNKTNIAFFGRIAPNKKQEDLITSFYYYKKYKNPSSRLILVGSYNEEDVYYRKLVKYIDELELKDVILTGHIPFETLLAYYHKADLLLCLSEHEGFCVPLVEAMYFKLPIIAYDSTAVGETLGKGGLLLKEKKPQLVAEAIDYVMTNDEVRNQLIEAGSKQLEQYRFEKTEQKFAEILDPFITDNNNVLL